MPDTRRALLASAAGSSSSLSGYGSLVALGGGGGGPGAQPRARLGGWQSGALLVSFMTGSGLLCLPLALVEVDWYAVVLLAAAAAVSAYASRLLIEAMDVVRWTSGARVSYSDLGFASFGRAGQLATGALVHVTFLITCTGYLSLAAACVSGITGLRVGTGLVLVAACVWLHVLVKSLKALALFSVLNVALAFWIEVVIFGDAMYPLTQIALSNPAFEFITPDLTGASMFVKLSYSFSLLASGFFCHAIVPTVYNAMLDYRESARVVTLSQLGAMALLYLPICVVTFAVYGDSLQAPVFFNMRNTFVRNLTVVLYVIHLLLSYAVAIYPLQRAIERWLLKISRCGGGSPPSSLPHVQAGGGGIPGSASSHFGGENDDHCRSASYVEVAVKLLSRTALMLVTLWLSYTLRPTALTIFGWMLVPVTLLGLVLPSVFYLKICREEARTMDIAAVVGVLVLALGTMSCSLTIFI